MKQKDIMHLWAVAGKHKDLNGWSAEVTFLFLQIVQCLMEKSYSPLELDNYDRCRTDNRFKTIYRLFVDELRGIGEDVWVPAFIQYANEAAKGKLKVVQSSPEEHGFGPRGCGAYLAMVENNNKTITYQFRN